MFQNPKSNPHFNYACIILFVSLCWGDHTWVRSWNQMSLNHVLILLLPCHGSGGPCISNGYHPSSLIKWLKVAHWTYKSSGKKKHFMIVLAQPTSCSVFQSHLLNTGGNISYLFPNFSFSHTRSCFWSVDKSTLKGVNFHAAFFLRFWSCSKGWRGHFELMFYCTRHHNEVKATYLYYSSWSSSRSHVGADVWGTAGRQQASIWLRDGRDLKFLLLTSCASSLLWRLYPFIY